MIVFCVPQPSILFLQQPLKLMIMEIVNIEASTFMEMNNILFKIEKQMKGLNFSKPELSEWLEPGCMYSYEYIRQKTIVSKAERANPFQSYRQKGLL